MFVPENAIERALIAAARNPAARAAFARTLLEAQVYLALVPTSGTLIAGADGRAVVPAGARLEVRTFSHGAGESVPFFTAPSRAEAAFSMEHIVTANKSRDLFTGYPNTAFWLNPGSDYGKHFTVAEIGRLLDGDFEEPPAHVIFDTPTSVLVSEPAVYPHGLAAKLAALFRSAAPIGRAFLAQHSVDGKPANLVIGIDADIPWDDLMRLLGPQLSAVLANGPVVDFVPSAKGSFASYFAARPAFYTRVL